MAKGTGFQGSDEVKRMKRILRDNIRGVTKGSIRRLARRAGVKRMSGLVYEDIRAAIKVFVTRLVDDTRSYTHHAKRQIATPLDVVHALKKQGRMLYGYA